MKLLKIAGWFFIIGFLILIFLGLSRLYIDFQEYLLDNGDNSQYIEYLYRTLMIREEVIKPLEECVENGIMAVIESKRVTAYNIYGKMSSGMYSYEGAVAVSRDLYDKYKDRNCLIFLYNGNRYDYLGCYKILDKMHEKYDKSFDIYMYGEDKCKDFGVRKGLVIIY